MSGWTERDRKATQLAQERYNRTDPTERMTFQRYLEDAYQHLVARDNPGEHSDPYAE